MDEPWFYHEYRLSFELQEKRSGNEIAGLNRSSFTAATHHDVLVGRLLAIAR